MSPATDFGLGSAYVLNQRSSCISSYESTTHCTTVFQPLNPKEALVTQLRHHALDIVVLFLYFCTLPLYLVAQKLNTYKRKILSCRLAQNISLKHKRPLPASKLSDCQPRSRTIRWLGETCSRMDLLAIGSQFRETIVINGIPLNCSLLVQLCENECNISQPTSPSAKLDPFKSVSQAQYHSSGTQTCVESQQFINNVPKSTYKEALAVTHSQNHGEVNICDAKEEDVLVENAQLLRNPEEVNMTVNGMHLTDCDGVDHLNARVCPVFERRQARCKLPRKRISAAQRNVL